MAGELAKNLCSYNVRMRIIRSGAAVAKQPVSKSGTSRIRFIMLDAEIPDGDLSQITSAIQNALKPVTIIQQRMPTNISTPGLPNGVLAEQSNDFDEEVIEPEVEIPVVRSAREPRQRKPTVPKVIDLDLVSGVSLESYVNQHPPKSDVERNLVVAAWFKEHRNEDVITANHVYTCYRALKWPAGIEDFSWPLRNLKKDQLVTSSVRGQYAINHLGIARVEKMGAGA